MSPRKQATRPRKKTGKAKAKTNAAAAEPARDRPHAPGYGISESPRGMLAWRTVRRRIADSRNYWIGSTRPDGAPHAMPVWGVWVAGRLYFGTSRGSRKGQNLARDPRAVVHLESGDDVVILEGTVEELDDRAIYRKIAKAYGEKYPGFAPDPDGELGPDGVTYGLRIHRALAWREKDFPKCATRFRFA